MSKIVEGFRDLVWVVDHFDSYDLVSSERFSLHDMSETEIVAMLEEAAKAHLTADEIETIPEAWKVRKDHRTGNRLIYTAGLDHHHVASLYRADELAAKDASNGE